MTAPHAPDEREVVDLDIEGMTCASCASRVQQSLNRLEGVHASVNFATERARVEHPPSTSTEELVAAVRATGYTASPTHSAESRAGEGSAA